MIRTTLFLLAAAVLLPACGLRSSQPDFWAQAVTELKIEVSDRVQVLQVQCSDGDLEILDGSEDGLLLAEVIHRSGGATDLEAEAKLGTRRWVYREEGRVGCLELRMPREHEGRCRSSLRSFRVPERLAVQVDVGEGKVDLEGTRELFDLRTESGDVVMQMEAGWSGSGTAHSASGNVVLRYDGQLDTLPLMEAPNGTAQLLGPAVVEASSSRRLHFSATDGNVSVTHTY